jgi:hypothetical protein
LGVICVHKGLNSWRSPSQQLLSLSINSPFVMKPEHVTYPSNNSVYIILPYTFNNIFNILFPSSPWYSKWFLQIFLLTFCVYLPFVFNLFIAKLLRKNNTLCEKSVKVKFYALHAMKIWGGGRLSSVIS